MESPSLIQLIEDIEYAKKCINQVGIAYKTGVITERERHSSEGIGLGSALYGLTKEIERASSCLRLLNAYRNPEEHKEFLRNLRMCEDPNEDYSESICPPPSDED